MSSSSPSTIVPQLVWVPHNGELCDAVLLSVEGDWARIRWGSNDRRPEELVPVSLVVYNLPKRRRAAPATSSKKSRLEASPVPVTPPASTSPLPTVPTSSVQALIPDLSVSDTSTSAVESTSSTPDIVPSLDTKIKTEQDHRRKVMDRHRLYGNRVLLARQAANGMMKLGGGNVTMELIPSLKNKKNANHLRFAAVDHVKAIAYNERWQPFGPQYAGQPYAHVMCHPSNLKEDEAFAVFMHRRVVGNKYLGWEYCGQYRLVKDDEEVQSWTPAYQVRDGDKKKMISDIHSSIAKENGEWKPHVQQWREELTLELEDDPSPAAPEWLKEGRKPTEQEAQEKVPSLAARTRALGFYPTMPGADLANVMVQLDEFHKTIPIQFVEYSDKIYNYVQNGESKHNATGHMRAKNAKGEMVEPCAKALDWYAFCDLNTAMNG